MEREALKLAQKAMLNANSISYEMLHAITAIKEVLAQPAQEPVAWWNDMGGVIDLNVSGRGKPLYTTPPQRPWIGLTDGEIHRKTILAGFNPEWTVEIGLVLSIVRNLEAKLKERNHG